MFHFITENEIGDLEAVSLPSETRLHITFFPTFPSCPYCGRTFSGKNPFTFFIFKNSIFLLDRVMKQLRDLNDTYLMIAQSNHISVTQVQQCPVGKHQRTAADLYYHFQRDFQLHTLTESKRYTLPSKKRIILTKVKENQEQNL